MSDASVRANGGEARQSLIRFWMAISAVWLAFWLLIAGIFFLNVDIPYIFSAEIVPFTLIVLTPPAALLAIGILGCWAFQAFAEVPLRSSEGE
jgi:hypothetical protein